MEKWPFKPNGFASILPGDLPYFIQVGANASIGRAVSIIDPTVKGRIDAFNKFDRFSPFCHCLREGCISAPNRKSLDTICNRCDIHVAERLTQAHSKNPEAEVMLKAYRCYMGLLEIATTINVGGISVMIVSGQFRPPEGVSDIGVAISSIGSRRPAKSDVSSAMWRSMEEFDYPGAFWTDTQLLPSFKEHLQSHLEELVLPPNGFEEHLIEHARRIKSLAQTYYEMAEAHVEGGIMREVTDAFSHVTMDETPSIAGRVEPVLETLRKSLNVRYLAFLAGAHEKDTILTLRASAGDIPAKVPHFNWRKASLKTRDERDTHDQVLDSGDAKFSHLPILQKGFRGHTSAFASAEAVIPVILPQGPCGVLVLGPRLDDERLVGHEGFLLSCCRDLATRVLTLQLSQILKDERANWERTSMLTGHRVRACIQDISSQLDTLDAERRGQPGIGPDKGREAEQFLNEAFHDLEEISYAAESSASTPFDVRSVQRENIPLAEIIWAAVESQQDLADENDIDIAVHENTGDLPSVWVNRTLLRFAFMNLVNNGLKYSFPQFRERRRVLQIARLFDDDHPEFATVQVTNFGLGIKAEDRDRIFNWGERLAEGAPSFRSVYGKGIGLWEVKHIIEGHGGKVLVRSMHHSGVPVTDANTSQCVTSFVVKLRVLTN